MIPCMMNINSCTTVFARAPLRIRNRRFVTALACMKVEIVYGLFLLCVVACSAYALFLYCATRWGLPTNSVRKAVMSARLDSPSSDRRNRFANSAAVRGAAASYPRRTVRPLGSVTRRRDGIVNVSAENTPMHTFSKLTRNKKISGCLSGSGFEA